MTDSSEIWSSFKTQSSGWARWNDKGDKVEGTVKEIRVGVDMNGNRCPEVVVTQDDDTDITVTASQAQLRSKLIASPMSVGDYITITFEGTERREGGRTLKTFSVEVNG